MDLPSIPSRGGGDTLVLTQDHKYRVKALNVPGAFYDRDHKAYVVTNPSPRAARAVIAFFPDVLVDNPWLFDRSTEDYGTARPHSYADELQIKIDVGPLGSKTLHPWQETDSGYLAAILQRDGGAHVGWDRGLGKTLITAAFIRKLAPRRTLVVARNDAKEPVWLPELSQALPDHHIVVLPNEKVKRERLLDAVELGEYDDKPLVLIIHYEAIRVIAGDKVVHHSDGDEVIKAGGDGWKHLGHWDLMAYDEAHRLASYNPNSRKNTQMGRALSKLRRKYVGMAINLTGSGVMNRPDDMFGQLHFILPKTYSAKWADWNDRFVDYVNDGNRDVAIGFKAEALPTMRKELGVFMVYRHKRDPEVNLHLPPIIRQDIELDMLPEQRRAYMEVRDKFWTTVQNEGVKAANALSQMNLLRRIATAYPGLPSAKLDFTYGELEETPDEQFVVFTWYKFPGRSLAERLGDSVVVVDGDVPVRHRAELLDRHKRGQARILVGSIATLGESLNLQYVHEAIRLDRDWNPEVNGQTVDRLDRQGQQERVTFRDLWTRGSVDTLRVRPVLSSKDSIRKAVFG